MRQCRAIGLSMGPSNCCIGPEGHSGPHYNTFGWTFELAVEKSIDLHDAMVKLHGCRTHRRYRAKKLPSSGCSQCWRLWVLTHPNIELETRWLVAR